MDDKNQPNDDITPSNGDTISSNPVSHLNEVINAEKAYLKERRKILNNGEYKEEIDNYFGLALSGGGIRSAIINLGFLRYLNEKGILKKADYISTVSGGGYTGAYVQATLLNSDNLKKETEKKAEQLADTNTEIPEKTLFKYESKSDSKEIKESLNATPNPYPFEELYREERIQWLVEYGNYMAPGIGLGKKFNNSLLGLSYVSSLIMSWIGPFLALASFYFIYVLLSNNFSNDVSDFGQEFLSYLFKVSAFGIILLIVGHFILNTWYNYSLNISLRVDRLKAWFVALILLCLTGHFIVRLINAYSVGTFGFTRNEVYTIGAILLLALAGFFANPNSLSLHRYYRKRLADAFLSSGGKFQNVPLHKLANRSGDITNYAAPYPLINTCLNLQGGQNDDSFQGAKSGDYFLLSPFYSGSKLTGYLSTKENAFYNEMTLPAAMAISAAAVNPGMGTYSSRIKSILTTVFNFRLGYWVLSPKRMQEENDLAKMDLKSLKDVTSKESTHDLNYLIWKRDTGKLTLKEEPKLEILLKKKSIYKLKRWGPIFLTLRKLVWWPKYFIYELFSGINSKHRMLNISDGGHIENLAVFELLRRRCKLIIGIDAGADPHFSFDDLQNLIVRARNELGIEIKFRKDQIPESVIKPRPSFGYSRTHFAVADILEMTTKRGKKGKIGTFVYVKSSVTAPGKKKDLSLQSKSYKYKTFHASFPHEPTSDQFFDEAQWEAYYYLGYFIAQDVLLGRVHASGKTPPLTIDQLYNHFENYEHRDPVYDDPDKAKGFMEYEEFKEEVKEKNIELDINPEQKR